MTSPRVTSTWSFPRHRPQMHAPSAAGLRSAHRYYSFGRDVGSISRLGLSAVLATPGVRRLVAMRDFLELPFDIPTLERILARVGGVVEQDHWAIFSSSWHNRRLIIFSFDSRSRCTGVTHVNPETSPTFHPETSGREVRVPKVVGVDREGGWHLRTIESIPPWHTPHPWDVARLTRVLGDVAGILADQVGDPPSNDWVPIHGDLTPWNLRLDQDDQAWLLDWEWAGWGPELADLLRFAIARASLTMDDPSLIREWITAQLPGDPHSLAEAAEFWLAHRIYRGDPAGSADGEPEGVRAARAQAGVEATVLRALAGTS